MATHAGMTTEEFEQIVKDWIATAKHPKTKRLFTEMVYQPMLELLAYLRANGFKTFIVSGGGIEFMRPWTEQGLWHPARAGRRQQRQDEVRDARRQARAHASCPRSTSSTTRPASPIGIQQHIGRRPIAAFGNSDGDLQMLQWTAAGSGAALLPLIVHHTDAEREWAYDRQSAHRPARQGARRGAGERLDGRRA